MDRRLLLITVAITMTTLSMGVQASSLDWDAFVIRNANGTGDVPSFTENADGVGLTTSIIEAGQKVGYGTTGVDGMKLGNLVSVSYDRDDAVITNTNSPYLNIWITDGAGDYALISPVQGAKTNGGYLTADVDGLSLQSLGFNIYDNTAANFDWIFPGAKIDAGPNSLLQSDGSIITLSQIANLRIVSGPATPTSDTGAPQNGDGFNLIFGDKQGNSTQADPYVIDNLTLTTVPLPSAVWGGLALLAGVGIFDVIRRRKQSAGRVLN